MNAMQELDALIDSLDRAAASQTATNAGSGDAIDAVLANPSRTTEVRSLRHDPIIAKFRQEAQDGLIRIDTAGKLLGLVSQVVNYAISSRI